MAESLPTASSAEAPQLTVAVLSYDGRHLLEVILPSLARQRFRDFEVVVVDNGSRDDTASWLRERWPQVELVSLAQNIGVTAALNVCARAGRGELVGLFNNDLELDPDCLGELVAALRRASAGGLGRGEAARLRAARGDRRRRRRVHVGGDGRSPRARRARRRPVRRAASDLRRLRRRGGVSPHRRCELVGDFDEDFFAFYEDVDWNLRAQLAGLSCRYVPSAVVYHMGSATIGRGLSDFTRYHLWRNTLWIIAKDLPGLGAGASRPQLALGQALNLAVAIRDRKLGIWLRVWRDALRGLPRALAKAPRGPVAQADRRGGAGARGGAGRRPLARAQRLDGVGDPLLQ